MLIKCLLVNSLNVDRGKAKALLFSTGVLLLTVFVNVMFSVAAVASDNVHREWGNSGHADSESGAFTHWNEDGFIPEGCAACHAESGFLDYIGDDASTALEVDKPHSIGSVVGCNVCHNDTVKSLASIPFPSGVGILVDDKRSATCMVCHQGRASTESVDALLVTTSEDKIDPDLGFINIHYKAAAATLYGSEVRGGYQYKQRDYNERFTHVPGFDSCAGCHNPHTLKVETETCIGCHQQASSSIKNIRIAPIDFDGDNNNKEGIASEIDFLHNSLGVAIVVYANQFLNSPILYDSHTYPYFFHDKNKNLIAGEDEIQYPNRYKSWTPRLLRAAYNYQYVAKDPGAYAHNPKYVIQLLYDSLDSLSAVIEFDMRTINRP